MLENRYLGRAAQIFITNPLEYMAAGLITLVLTVLSAGLLAGPAACGAMAMTLKRTRNQKVVFMDAFKGFDKFTATFGAGLALLGMVIAGSVLFLLPGLFLLALFGFTLPAIMDGATNAGEGIRRSRLLTGKDILGNMLMMITLVALALSGAIFMLVGLLVTVPLALIALTLAYDDLAREHAGVAAETKPETA
jgi:uncharacterized membrane protein